MSRASGLTVCCDQLWRLSDEDEDEDEDEHEHEDEDEDEDEDEAGVMAGLPAELLATIYINLIIFMQASNLAKAGAGPSQCKVCVSCMDIRHCIYGGVSSYIIGYHLTSSCMILHYPISFHMILQYFMLSSSHPIGRVAMQCRSMAVLCMAL